jgi:hypothetical protein
MKPVEWRWASWMEWFTDHPKPVDVNRLIKTLCTAPWNVDCERLEVRYDNGQLCTFRIKPRPRP